MDGGGVKSSVGRHMEAWRRNENNRKGFWRWQLGRMRRGGIEEAGGGQWWGFNSRPF
jgi:hypothetical protein